MVSIFEQGDILYMDFDPQAGHEQRGRRPAVVVSNNVYNRYSKTLMVAPSPIPIKNTRSISSWTREHAPRA